MARKAATKRKDIDKDAPIARHEVGRSSPCKAESVTCPILAKNVKIMTEVRDSQWIFETLSLLSK